MRAWTAPPGGSDWQNPQSRVRRSHGALPGGAQSEPWRSGAMGSSMATVQPDRPTARVTARMAKAAPRKRSSALLPHLPHHGALHLAVGADALHHALGGLVVLQELAHLVHGVPAAARDAAEPGALDEGRVLAL